MCEMTAAWIISTYFLDAFDVVGYLWPSGEKGSGKTQFLNTVSRIAFLGKTVTAGSSFASLRDEAQYGAVLAFDDCEDLKGMETSKRELLLAGNTRGTLISHKVPTSDGGWITEDVNSFSPRLFSSIAIPDEVLNSRTITVPLIRSTDTSKTRLSPTGTDKLPVQPGNLIDDLWLLGALHLPDVKACDELASEESRLTARDHDIWRPILAVAYWLQHSEGVEDVFERMSASSESFTEERTEESPLDLHSMVLMAANSLLQRSDKSSS